MIERAEPVEGAPFRLVSVCRIEPKKGLLDLVEAVHLLHTLAKQPYMLGECFTAVDILYIELFEHLRHMIVPSERIDAYIARGDRPARRRPVPALVG